MPKGQRIKPEQIVMLLQFIKMGVFLGGADLEVIPEEQGKAAVLKLELATNGTCGK